MCGLKKWNHRLAFYPTNEARLEATGRSSNQAFQAHRFTSYDRDANGGDDAIMRRYQSNNSRFFQPDPYDGSYNLADPQSFNRYAYVRNDFVL